MPDGTRASGPVAELGRDNREEIPKVIARIRNKLTYSNVIASLALFVALGGVAVAAGLPKNSVGPKQLKKNAVTAAKIKKGAVNSAKIARTAR